MRFDVQNELGVAQAYTGAAVSANSYQKQSAAQDLSIGILMAMLFEITTAAGAGTSVLFEAIQADDAALTTNIDVLASTTVLAAKLLKGTEVSLVIPPGTMSRLYLGTRVTPTGGTATISCSSFFVAADDIPKYKSFPKVVDALV